MKYTFSVCKNILTHFPKFSGQFLGIASPRSFFSFAATLFLTDVDKFCGVQFPPGAAGRKLNLGRQDCFRNGFVPHH